MCGSGSDNIQCTPPTTTAVSREREHSPFNNYKKQIDQQEQEAAARLAEMEAKLKEMQEKLKVSLPHFN